MTGSDPRRFQLTDSSPLKLLWVVLPILAVMVIGAWVQRQKASPDAPWMEVTLSPPYFLMGGSAAWSLAVVALLGVVMVWAFFRRRVELADGMLDVRATLYRRRTPVASLLLDQAEVVDLRRDRRHALRRKANGYGMPGFHAGHYYLQDGGKGFVLLTDQQRVLVLPVQGGGRLLLSVAQPQMLLEALRGVAAGTTRR